MRITQLKAENVKRLQAIDITPDGSFVQITGRNGQGKTSVLDSIAYALGGKEMVCERPVRDGQDRARIVCTLDDLIITRTFTASGSSTLKVTNSAGTNYPSPQAMLDKLVGKLAFDPLAFSRMSSKQQAETLRVLLGLDFSDLEISRKSLFEKRTAVNGNIKTLSAQLSGIQHHPDAPAEEVLVADLMTKLGTMESVNREVAQRESDLQADMRLLATYENDITALEQKLIHAKHRRDEQMKSVELRRESLAKVTPVDVTPLRAQIAGADVVNRKVRENAKRSEIEKQIISENSESQIITERIAVLDEEKSRRLADAPYPVSGLEFDESGVLFNGIPFAQASAAEQLRVSVAMGIAMNPTLRVLLIRDGSLLDAESLKLIAGMAETSDSQIWIEKVSDGGGVGIVIEDGMISETTVSQPVA